ncbi:MAG: hypothetical protein V1901_02790 [Patescibacteria group bacterium]
MLSDFKKFVKNNEPDIILTISIVLISLIVFGIVLLINFSNNKEKIIIQNPSASVIESIKQGMFVGSINSTKYHWPDCSFAKRISEENQVWFSSEQEAQDAGYIKCSSFEKYAPKNN